MKPFKRILASLALAFVTALSFAPSAQAQAMSDYLENKIVDHIFRGTSYTAPTVLAVALFLDSSNCTDAGGGTEVSTTNTNYARVTINPSTTNWTDTSGGTGATSSGTGGQTSNAVAITFPAPKTSATGGVAWGLIGSFGIYDSATVGAGNLLICKTLAATKTVNADDAAPSFAIGALTVTFQ